jgi:hypothetical protein
MKRGSQKKSTKKPEIGQYKQQEEGSRISLRCPLVILLFPLLLVSLFVLVVCFVPGQKPEIMRQDVVTYACEHAVAHHL